MKTNNNKIRKEEIAEDYCFICKDGGLLLVCDYRNCLKAYHPECVGKESEGSTILGTSDQWICSWHSCFLCHKRSKFHCFCCTNAVCQRCINAAEFVHVRGTKGFCNHCLKLALLIEENVDVDSDGGKVDFKDRETYEFLFKEYWEIVKEKEGITLESLCSAYSRLKSGENYKSGLDSDKFAGGKDVDQILPSDIDYMRDGVEDMAISFFGKSKKKKSILVRKIKEKIKSKKKEFIGWGSKSLIEFLASIGKDTSIELSQYDVTAIINRYIHEHHLLHPVKKKKVLCDARLQSVFGRKSVNRNKIYDLLESHFAENQEESEEDECGYASEEANISISSKRRRMSRSDKTMNPKAKALETPRSRFASVISDNIKLVYLKRSLVEDLLKQPDSFEAKVYGSFVRVKFGLNDFFQKHSHRLVQVTGIKKALRMDDSGIEVLLQVSNTKNDILICMLSDDDFSEEECEDLRQRMNDGLLTRPTVVELEQRVRILHEDIVKHSIVRELSLLQNLIDRANEKGWRRELCEYLERKRLLQTPSEQLRLLQEVPKVIADEQEELEINQDSKKDVKQGNDASPRSILVGACGIPVDDLKGSGIKSYMVFGTVDTAEEKQHISGLPIPEEKQHHVNVSASDEVQNQSSIVNPEDHSDVLAHGSSQECGAVLVNEQQIQKMAADKEGTRESQVVDADQNDETEGGVNKQRVLALEVIELSDDEDESDGPGKQIGENPESSIWHYTDLSGNTHGPFAMSLLKRWSESNYFPPDFKVWKTNQSPEEATLLNDVLRWTFPIEAGRR